MRPLLSFLVGTLVTPSPYGCAPMPSCWCIGARNRLRYALRGMAFENPRNDSCSKTAGRLQSSSDAKSRDCDEETWGRSRQRNPPSTAKACLPRETSLPHFHQLCSLLECQGAIFVDHDNVGLKPEGSATIVQAAFHEPSHFLLALIHVLHERRQKLGYFVEGTACTAPVVSHTERIDTSTFRVAIGKPDPSI